MRFFLAIVICIACGFSSVSIADVKYYSDPVYKKLNDEDHHPMDDIMDLAQHGDARAQYILGDMYAKGKGGFAKDLDQARHWFEESAIHDYSQAFIRLAAMAKRGKNFTEAWQWYTLAVNTLEYSPERTHAIAARKALVEGQGLTAADTEQARKSIQDWKEGRRKRLRAEIEAAEKEEPDKDKPGEGASATVVPPSPEKAEQEPLAAGE